MFQVIKPRLSKPGRTPVTTCAWNRDGKCIAGGIGDGSIQVLLNAFLFDLTIYAIKFSKICILHSSDMES